MFARTERLLLRPAFAEDSAPLFRAIADEAIVCNLASAPWPYQPADAEKWIATARTPQRPASLIFRRTGDAPELIGGIGMHDTDDGHVELGYWLARGAWGRGYATEAGRAMIGFARDGLRLKRLVAGHFLDNPVSGHVLRKLGFRPTGSVTMRHSAARGSAVPAADFVLELNLDSKDDGEPLNQAACSMAA